jgi:NAD(P)-dependent dehydrogenase (short-subunit alcohol dehydrogenase family)
MERESFIDFGGKMVWVTGASSGIGRAVAVELSRRRAGLILVGRNERSLHETAGLLDGSGHEILKWDLSNLAGLEAVVRDLARKMGRLYGFCHSAGIVQTRPLNSNSPEIVQTQLNVNLLAGLELARIISRRDVMQEDGGSLLFISSIYARVGMPGQIGYSASKGAVTAAARTMAVELARRKIRVNTLSPGLVKTDMIAGAFAVLSSAQAQELEAAYPLGTGTPEDVARAAAFLLAPQNRWITGLDLVIDGGYSAR